MSTQAHKAIVRNFVAATDQGDLAALEPLLSPHFRFYPPGGMPPMDREGFKQFVTMFRGGFPDFTHTVEHETAEGDLVALHITWRATHRGEFMGVSPTGRQVTMAGMGFFRIENDRIEEHWAVPDVMNLLQQIGALPSQAQPAAAAAQ